MNPERWQQIDWLLSEALKREPGERRVFLYSQLDESGSDLMLVEYFR